MSDLTLLLTPYIYCHLVQVHKLFYTSQNQTLERIEPEDLIMSFSKLSNNAAMKGPLTK